MYTSESISAGMIILAPTNQPTPWSRVLLEKLRVTHVIKEFYTFYRTQRFIIMYTRAHHWSII
jgi:hypothetical protein